MKITWNGELYHYGMPRRSGRYKWGSGKNPYHHGADTVRAAKKEYKQAKKEASKNQNKYNFYGGRHPIGTVSYAVGAKPVGRYGRNVRKNLDSRYSKWEDSVKNKVVKQKEYKDTKAKVKVERKEAIANAKNERYKQKQREKIDKVREKQNRQLQLTDEDKKLLVNARDYKQIYNYKNQYSDDEMESILKRAKSEKKLSDIKNEQIAEGNKIVRDVLKPYGQAATAAVDSLNKFESAGNYATSRYKRGASSAKRIKSKRGM